MSILPHKAVFRAYRYDQIDFVWDDYRGFIQSALDQGSNYTLEQIYEGLKNRDMQLWVWGTEAALVTTIQDNWCLLLACGGKNMSKWVKCLPHIEDWARQNGCNQMRIYGRIGWAKVLDYNIKCTLMDKDL